MHSAPLLTLARARSCADNIRSPQLERLSPAVLADSEPPASPWNYHSPRPRNSSKKDLASGENIDIADALAERAPLQSETGLVQPLDSRPPAQSQAPGQTAAEPTGRVVLEPLCHYPTCRGAIELSDRKAQTSGLLADRLPSSWRPLLFDPLRRAAKPGLLRRQRARCPGQDVPAVASGAQPHQQLMGRLPTGREGADKDCARTCLRGQRALSVTSAGPRLYVWRWPAC